ncbi:thioredoxin-disulfide reductase [Natrialba magadii ATCC 43099]|uniref:Thioredoxin reductase n=1 Tax=Natrialba magadii (strain ATCC 43099 / DSM 3394 / CCM 3739 / CIP 104546 / IAM 13178 / JCM 8861 / NBRC 102185 / NCIMB 2190 / MS3) TaxID=547559 RepID=D3T010_NATMM|nr:FAD-dependent oxidoreductase [Natrialba magadii]ADD04368.1 thioredoxin-disulfide reductase [Natrialba magadii ATCC 43099]ELY26008.1 thioredoxin reductase [Natrialba magadii ATCC 43099]
MSDQPRVEIYTKTNCPYCDKAKDLFDSKGIEYDVYNVTGDDELFEEMVERADGRKTAPEVFIDDELIGGWDDTSALEETGELDEKLGIADDVGNDGHGGGDGDGDGDGDDGGEDTIEHRPLIIAGTGIAGLTAAIYAGRSNNDPLVIEGDEPGGQLTLTTDVANYPGFPDGISGPELVNNMKEQAKQFGADLKNGIIDTVEADQRPFRVELTNGDVYTADAVIAASGASARTLGVPGEDELMGYGLSTCATCDGAFFRGEDMLVVGGGDAAMEEATFLTKFADTVYIAHRREEFRAEDYWIDRVHEKVEEGEIEIMKNTELVEVHGSQEAGVDHVTLVENDQGHPTDRLDDPETNEFEFDVGAVFLAIGHTPNTEYLEGTGVTMDDEGYLRTQGGDGGGQTETDVPGIFGAGDVVDYHYQQAVTAAGMGSKAALDVDEYLDDLERAEATSETEAAAADD